MEEFRKQSTIHVLMVAFAAQGHINPMLTLAKHLQSKGLHVTFATTEVSRDRILKNHNIISDDQLRPSFAGIDFEFFSDGLSLEYDRKTNLDVYMDSLAKFGPIHLSSLIASLSSDNQTMPKKFSCIMTNPFLPWVADVAAEHGVPCAMLWIQPCALFAIYHSYCNNLDLFPTKEDPEKSVQLSGLPLLQPVDLPSFVLPSNAFNSISRIFLEVMKDLHKFRWILANSFYELEKEVIDSISKSNINIKAVGPLVPPTLLGQGDHDSIRIDMWKPEDKCIEWLDRKDPSSVIYVSFGSIAALSTAQMENICNALRSSKRPFLWVVKKPDNPVPEGAGELPEGFLAETKEQGLVVPWCSQVSVLSHKSTACFLTHCGWNSILETVSAGIPVIAYPMWSDQPTNAKLVTDVFSIGLRLWPNENGMVACEDIVKCIDDITVGPLADEIRAKAAECKKLARDAMATVGSSERNLQEFVNDITEIAHNKESENPRRPSIADVDSEQVGN